jgi:hypothetical protein
MKKFIFAIGALALSFSASAQCNEQSTGINTSCGGSYCYSVQMQLTGYLSIDIGLLENSGNSMFRKPNQNELSLMIMELEALCD